MGRWLNFLEDCSSLMEFSILPSAKPKQWDYNGIELLCWRRNSVNCNRWKTSEGVKGGSSRLIPTQFLICRFLCCLWDNLPGTSLPPKPNIPISFVETTYALWTEVLISGSDLLYSVKNCFINISNDLNPETPSNIRSGCTVIIYLPAHG